MEPTTTLAVARRYIDAIAANDFAALAAMFAPDIVWHQPGSHQFAGTHRGADAIGKLVGDMMTLTQGTFELTVTGDPMVNGALAALPVHFAGQHSGAQLDMDGIDILRVDGDQIAEVWLFSANQPDEDAFWDAT